MMDRDYPVTDQLSLCTTQVQLIAGLMVAGAGIQSVESEAFALMRQDLAECLYRMSRKTVHSLNTPCEVAGEEGP